MLRPEVVTASVIVTAISSGTPPLLNCYSHIRVTGDKERIQTQAIPVLDHNVLERLRHEVGPGDEIEVTIVTDWGAKGAPMSVTGFSRVGSTASAVEAPSAAG